MRSNSREPSATCASPCAAEGNTAETVPTSSEASDSRNSETACCSLGAKTACRWRPNSASTRTSIPSGAETTCESSAESGDTDSFAERACAKRAFDASLARSNSSSAARSAAAWESSLRTASSCLRAASREITSRPKAERASESRWERAAYSASSESANAESSEDLVRATDRRSAESATWTSMTCARASFSERFSFKAC